MRDNPWLPGERSVGSARFPARPREYMRKRMRNLVAKRPGSLHFTAQTPRLG